MKKRIAIVGVESSGKSTLAEGLSTYFKEPLVKEYAREYLLNLNRPYHAADLIEIAKGQIELENKVELSSSNLLICDTNLLVVIIWSMFKYQHCHPFILKEHAKRRYDVVFLTDYTVNWQPDPLREHPKLADRMRIQKMYVEFLRNNQPNFHLLSGNAESRLKEAIALIE